ncbi:MAG: hypothetical protein U1A78_05040 [Polyangia bacterium]
MHTAAHVGRSGRWILHKQLSLSEWLIVGAVAAAVAAAAALGDVGTGTAGAARGWESVGPFLDEVRRNGLSLPLLWSPHEEHRLPLPRLLFLLVHGSSPHPRLGLLLSLLLLAGTYRLLLPLLRSATHSGSSFPAPAPPSTVLAVLPALLCLCFFSLAQLEGLLRADQLAAHLFTLGLVMALLGIERPLSGRFWLGTALALASSGYWIVLLPLAALQLGLRVLYRRPGRGHRPLSAGEAAAGALRLGLLGGLLLLYLRHLPTEPLASSLAAAAARPLGTARELLVLLGGPFLFTPSLLVGHGAGDGAAGGPSGFSGLPALLGGLGFLTLFSALIYNHRKQIKERILPELWLPLAAIALSALICISRAGELTAAEISRYQAFVIFGWIGLLCGVLRSPGLWRRRALRGMVALVVVGFVLGSIGGLAALWRGSAHAIGRPGAAAVQSVLTG